MFRISHRPFEVFRHWEKVFPCPSLDTDTIVVVWVRSGPAAGGGIRLTSYRDFCNRLNIEGRK